MAGPFSLFSKLFGAKKPDSDYQLADRYSALRNMLFRTRAAEIGLELPDDEISVWGVLVEMAHPGVVVTLVALADGTVSLYFSNGGGIIGLGPHDGPRKAAESLLKFAPGFLSCFQATQTFPLPGPSKTRFYLLTNNDIVTAEADEAKVVNGRHALSPLFFKANDLITEIRIVDEARTAKGSNP